MTTLYIEHRLIRRPRKTPHGTRWRVRCQTCRDEPTGWGANGEVDTYDAITWVGQHVGAPVRSIAKQVFDAAGRWPA